MWLDPALPFEEEPTLSGSTEVVAATDDGTTVEVQATIPLLDTDGNEVGDAELVASAARTGDVNVIGPDTGKTNFNENDRVRRVPRGQRDAHAPTASRSSM